MSELAWGELLPRTLVLPEHPDAIVVRPVMSLTAYVKDEGRWAAELAAELLQDFLSRPGSAGARYFQTSVLEGWRRFDEQLGLVRALRSARGPRHLFRVSVADRADVPTVGFSYREVKPGPTGRCGWVQWVLPLETPADQLMALTTQVADRYPVISALAGPTALASERLVGSAWRGVFRLCKRFVGLDIQSPDEAGRVARQWLPSIGWLTLVGEELMAAQGLEAEALTTGLPAALSVRSTAAGLLFRAGTVPELGDLNTLETPRTLQALHRQLRALLAPEGLELHPDFRERRPRVDEEPVSFAKAWRERLLQPEQWG